MNKLIILTASIIRGDFHKKTIGRFYEFFYEYLKKYDIYHIINIDEPTKLKIFFNKYETMQVYNEIIPEKVNTVFINEPNPGFLQAYKKLVSKVEELDLINDDYLYYWLEDDWEPKSNYNIEQIFTLLKYPNTSYAYTNSSPLGSFRGGPFMTGTYFKNVFNIRPYMNDTCDPERQMQRWTRGGNNKNGHSFMHRLSIANENIDNKQIHLIIVCPTSKIETSDLCNWLYKSPPYERSISFQFHLITYNEHFELQYSIVKDDKYDLKSITQTELDLIFNNLSIKHFVIKPIIMVDRGRQFNEKYDLKKWAKITDGTSYSSIEFYNAQLGNWKLLDRDNLRLKPEITMNKGFFSAFAYIHQCLPYLEKEYFNKDIFLNIMYYSHNYGSYPNFQVIGDVLQLNYKPSINIENKQFEELTCFGDLCRKICGRQQKDEDTTQYQSFKNDFTLANEYLFKYFKFHPSVTENVELFTKQFNNKKVFGLHYRGTDKNKVNWVTHISMEEFMLIIDHHLKHNHYDVIFISTDDFQFIDKMKERYDKDYTILFYDKEKNSNNKNSIHLDRLKVMENKTKEIKDCKKDIEKLVTLEHELKLETQYNRILFENVVVNSFLLSKCDLVLKTHSQVSAYSKVFNPELEIYRVNACQEGYWPDSHIPLYEYQNVDDIDDIDNIEVKKLLEEKLKNEFSREKKTLFNSMKI
jgi:hypothetical protein